MSTIVCLRSLELQHDSTSAATMAGAVQCRTGAQRRSELGSPACVHSSPFSSGNKYHPAALHDSFSKASRATASLQLIPGDRWPF